MKPALLFMENFNTNSIGITRPYAVLKHRLVPDQAEDYVLITGAWLIIWQQMCCFDSCLQ